MRNFRGQFLTHALNTTCTVELPGAVTGTQWGVGGVGATPTTTTLPCLAIPPRTQVNRENGAIVSIPLQLLIQDTAAHVSTACKVVFQGVRYQVMQLTRDGDLVQIITGKA